MERIEQKFADLFESARVADVAITRGRFDDAWTRLQEIERVLSLVPSVSAESPRLLTLLLKLLKRMQRESSYSPLNRAVERVGRMLAAVKCENKTKKQDAAGLE